MNCMSPGGSLDRSPVPSVPFVDVASQKNVCICPSAPLIRISIPCVVPASQRIEELQRSTGGPDDVFSSLIHWTGGGAGAGDEEHSPYYKYKVVKNTIPRRDMNINGQYQGGSLDDRSVSRLVDWLVVVSQSASESRSPVNFSSK